MRHIIAISDIHLSQLEHGTGLWMRYRQAPYIPDKELVAMLTALRERMRGEELELILNGDIFDFDAPWNEGLKIHLPKSRRTSTIALPVMEGILRDHSEFATALGGLLADGHTLVFVSGNHDVEMTMDEVRHIIREALCNAAIASGAASSRNEIGAHVLFRAWFHLTRDGALFEHGHQYDETNCYRTIMLPYDKNGANIAPTLGSLSSRYFSARLGYFNPHVDESFMLSFWGYVKHWVTYYLFSTRFILTTFFTGATKTIFELIKNRGKLPPSRTEQNRLAAIAETGADPAAIDRHLALAKPPVDERLPKLLNDLGIDRVGFGVLAVIAAALWIHFTFGWQMALASIPISGFIAYALLMPRRDSLVGLWKSVQQATHEIAKIHQAKAVVFGHTHHASGLWENGIFYGNTGSWSAAYRDVECTQPLTDARPLIWLAHASDNEPLRGGLAVWKDNQFIGQVPE
jgi:UDP-2,3-diacylglucosamine pyrophosphatase LpxH